MNWRLSSRIELANDRIPAEDAARQTRTAADILGRFDHQPGVVLADEVGMGKTYVALAVAASVVEATRFKYPVVVMIPAGVQEKWPREWDVFRRRCLPGEGKEIRATEHSIRRPSEFLQLLDDPAERRKHIIFLTHGALTNALTDPFVRLALMRQAMYKRPSLSKQRRALPRWAYRLLNYRPFKDEELVERLLSSHPKDWADVYEKQTGQALPDDPVPHLLARALARVDMKPLAKVLQELPLFTSASIDMRLRNVREAIRTEMRDVWKECLSELRLRLPLLILDEAHHAKNPYTNLAGLFADRDAQSDADALRGTLASVFDRMLFMTATPFQLGHEELLSVLRHFDSVRWTNQQERHAFQIARDDLRGTLDAAQTASLRLETAWSRLRPEDMAGLPGEWWMDPQRKELPEVVRAAAERISEVESRMTAAERLLKPWVIRHTRPNKDARRRYHPGAGILDETDARGGLLVSGPAVLPFLLAARAQALVAAQGIYEDKRGRAHFADGLASSFEAYRHTRQRVDVVVDEDAAVATSDYGGDDEVAWYLHSIDQALPSSQDAIWGEHPKIKATVQRVLELWRRGEKIVVFCFFVATGRALRNHISRAIKAELVQRGAEKLGLPADAEDEVMEALERFGERFFDPEAPVTKVAESLVDEVFADLSLQMQERTRARDIVLRFLRTPSFLVRYLDIANPDRAAALEDALDARDASGLGLRAKIQSLGEFLEQRVPEERAPLLDALERIPTGTFTARDQFDPGEHSGEREELLPNVRLANGRVARETRERLMLAFNTPFFPEVLVASAVMAEGVDLHLNCRYVIHHDLDWSPSVLEQRTGRIDRLGSKSYRCKQPIVVFEPYLEATQDEKQFRVVKYRERWFSAVMGEGVPLSEQAAEKDAEGVALPVGAASAMALDLSVR